MTQGNTRSCTPADYSETQLWNRLSREQSFVVEQAFCCLISRKSKGQINDTHAIDRLYAALQRLGDRATLRMLSAYVAHVGRTVAHPQIVRLLDQKKVELAGGQEATHELVPALSSDSVEPAMPTKAPRTSQKKARKAAAPKEAPPITPRKLKKATKPTLLAGPNPPFEKPRRTSIKLGDPEAEAPMRQCCTPGFQGEKPAFIEASAS